MKRRKANSPEKTLFENGTDNDRQPQSSPNGKVYEPLSSVWERGDGELLEAMLSFYPTIDPEPILDATYNAGRFWKGSLREV